MQCCAGTGSSSPTTLWAATRRAATASCWRRRKAIPRRLPPNGSAPGIVGLVPRGAPHTFGASIDPTVAGGLRIADPRGVLVGSAPLTPPIYDPGGPSTIIDRVVGDDRAGLLNDGLDISRARGDIQVIVVCGAHDAELDEILDRHGARTPVEVWQVLTGPTPGT